MNIYAMKKPKRINSFSVTLTILAAALGYVGWWYLPHWYPIFTLTGMMRGTCNDMYRQFDNKALLDRLLRDSRRTGLRLTENNFKLIREEYTEDDFLQMKQSNEYARQTLQKRGKHCRIKMRYEHDAPWPMIGKTTHLVWEKEVEAPLETITWKKQTWSCTCVNAHDGD